MAKFYVTTAIPYMNARPHMGHALEFVQADVLARRARLGEHEVFFLTGTDDHGLKNWQSARRLGQPAQDFVNTNAAIFRDLLQKLDVSNDFFIRTSDKQTHWPSAQKLWRELVKADDIYKKSYSGLYCIGHESFHPETELVNGECPDYPGKTLEPVKEENYFFRLSKYAGSLRAIIATDELRIIPESKKNEALAFIEHGLEDISFSRPKEKLPWGIPVPDDSEQMMYVWCDALSNYLSGVNYAEAGAKFQKFWPPDLQIIGKDILRFHAIIWPAMLLAAKLPLPKTLLVHGFLTFGGEKMSKTLGNVIDPFEMAERYGADALRYFLLREIPTTADGDFTEAKLKERYNADLANGIGNLVSRVLTVGQKHGREFTLDADDLASETKDVWLAYEKAFASYQFHDAVAAIWRLIQRMDEYFNQKEPWKMLGSSGSFPESVGDKLDKVLSSSVFALANIAWMLESFMPDTARRILDYLTLEDKKNGLLRGRKIALVKSQALFPRADA